MSQDHPPSELGTKKPAHQGKATGVPASLLVLDQERGSGNGVQQILSVGLLRVVEDLIGGG